MSKLANQDVAVQVISSCDILEFNSANIQIGSKSDIWRV